MVGRPRSFDREAALAAAVEQFWRTGYEGTSIAALTRAMGVTPPSLYAAFGDKDQLFREVSEVYAARTLDGVDQACAMPTVREAVARMLDDTARVHTDPTTPLGCLLLTEPRLDSQRDAVRRRLVDRIERGIVEGDVPADVDAGELASFLVAVMRGMSGAARDGASTGEVLGVARTALAAVPVAPTS